MQGQRRYHNLLACLKRRAKPGGNLLDIGHQVAVREDGTLWYPGRATRVLQQGNILRRKRRFVWRLTTATSQRGMEADRTRQTPGRHATLDPLDEKVDQACPQRREKIAHLRGHDVTHGSGAENRLQGVGKVLQHDDRGRA
jgi:hypothetical protein